MLSAYALSMNSGSYSLFCKKEKPAGFSFLLFHEKGRKEKLLQPHEEEKFTILTKPPSMRKTSPGRGKMSRK